MFYDGSGSYEDSLLQDASLSVRMWYSGLTTNSGWTGNLYEMVMWDERWVSWPIYPVIGTLSGATIGGNYIDNGSLLYSGITNDTSAKQAINNGWDFDNPGNLFHHNTAFFRPQHRPSFRHECGRFSCVR